MASIYTRIQRKVKDGDVYISPHAENALHDEGFSIEDLFIVILKPFNYFVYEDDPSHRRYAFEGYSKDERMLRIICFINHGQVIIKTCYEIFD